MWEWTMERGIHIRKKEGVFTTEEGIYPMQAEFVSFVWEVKWDMSESNTGRHCDNCSFGLV